MEKVYDRKKRLAGYFEDTTVYDKHRRPIGYIQGPMLLDGNGRRLAYLRDNVLYTMSGSPQAYYDGRAIRDMQGRRLGRVRDIYPGLLSAGLLLGGMTSGIKPYEAEGYNVHRNRYNSNPTQQQRVQPGFFGQLDKYKGYYQTGRTIINKYGPLASYAWKYALADPTFDQLGKMGGYWPLVSMVGRLVMKR
jgi:hypothetical protein